MIDELFGTGIINLEKQDLLFSQNSVGDNCYIVVSALQIVVTDTKNLTLKPILITLAPGNLSASFLIIHQDRQQPLPPKTQFY